MVDQRDLSGLTGHLRDDANAVGRVGQILDVSDALTGQAHQRDRRLAIMERDRG